MSKEINAYVEAFEALNFNFENQRKRISLVGFMPQQANSNDEKDEEGVMRSWFQVVGIYESAYNRKDLNGEVHQDNNSIKTLVVKVKDSHMRKYGISTSQLKKFIDDNYTGKKMLVLPTSEEKQSKKQQADKKYLPLPNQTEVTVLEDFDLYKFCGLADKSALENKKDKLAI